jgi:hypothetical protein
MHNQGLAGEILKSGWFVDQTVSRWRANLAAKLPREFCRSEDMRKTPVSHLEVFRSIENQLSVLFRDFTMPTYWGAFITEKSYNNFFVKYSVLKDRFERERDLFVSQYDDFRNAVDVLGRKIGFLEWKNLYSNGNPTEPFLLDACEKIRKKVPGKMELYNAYACKLIEYRLRYPFSEKESRQFLQEIATLYSGRLQSLCLDLKQEQTKASVLRINVQPRFLLRCDCLIDLWVFDDFNVLERLQRLRSSLEDTDIKEICSRAADLMELCVPRAAQNGWEWLFERNEHE